MRATRQKTRAAREDFDKYLLALRREERALQRQKYALGWDPLIPPVQKGWKRSFVLRDDLARGRHAAFFENLLQKINTHDWSHRKDFKVRKRRRGRKIFVAKTQYLKRFYQSQFDKMGFTEKERSFFHMETGYERRGKDIVLISWFVFSEPWRFRLQVKPNMIDKIREIDAVLEARIRQIRNLMERNDFRKRLCKITNGHYQWWDSEERKREKYAFKNKSLPDILQLIEE